MPRYIKEERQPGTGSWTWIVDESKASSSFVMQSESDGYGIEFYLGPNPQLEIALAMRLVTCADALAGMNPSAIKPLIDLLHRFVAYGREHERAVGLHDESNFLSTLEVALERLYDAGVTSSESNHPQAGSDA